MLYIPTDSVTDCLRDINNLTVIMYELLCNLLSDEDIPSQEPIGEMDEVESRLDCLMLEFNSSNDNKDNSEGSESS